MKQRAEYSIGFAGTAAGAAAGVSAAAAVLSMAWGHIRIEIGGRSSGPLDFRVLLAATAALLGVRLLVSVRALGLRGAARAAAPWGIIAAGGGLVVFYAAGFAAGLQRAELLSVPALLLAGAFLAAWATYGARRTARGVLSAFYLVAGCLAAYKVAGASADSPAPVRVTQAAKPASPPPAVIEGERYGILRFAPAEVPIVRHCVDGDWRNAAVLRGQQFVAARVEAADGATLRFSAAAVQQHIAGSARLIAIRGPERKQEVLWTERLATMASDKWTDVSVPLEGSGFVDVMFDVDEPMGVGAVAIANPRIARSAARRNVILLVVDALRADRMGLYGYERGTSREVDACAGSATVFRNTYAQAPWTVPSTASLLTSLRPSAHGMLGYTDVLDKRLETVSQLFSGAGYYTGCIQTNPNLTVDRGTARGFAEYRMHPVESRPREPLNFAQADRVNANILDWLDRNSDAPFFLYAHYMDVHAPYTPPAGYERFGSDPSGLYDGEVAWFSSQFGKLFDELRARGCLENTVVVLTSDHGEQFLEHGSTEHGNCLYSEELRIPLMIWSPGVAGGSADTTAKTIDIAVTLADLADAGTMEVAEGRSLRPALESQPMEDTAVFSELMGLRVAGRHEVSVLAWQYRLIVQYPDNKWKRRVFLYDVTRDPREYVNIASRRPRTLERLMDMVAGHVETEQALHAKLVPVASRIPLSREQADMLRSLGYLDPAGRDDATSRGTPEEG